MASASRCAVSLIVAQNFFPGEWAAGDIQEAEAPEGITLLEGSGVKGIDAGLQQDRYGTVLRVYVENNTKGGIELESEDACVNGDPISLWSWETVAADGAFFRSYNG